MEEFPCAGEGDGEQTIHQSRKVSKKEGDRISFETGSGFRTIN
jgi:hypothetical protein